MHLTLTGHAAILSFVTEDDCWLGGNVTILGGVTIGAGSTIGAGAVVTKDVPPRSVVVGNPGRVVKTIPVRKEGEETESEKREKWVTEREKQGRWGK